MSQTSGDQCPRPTLVFNAQSWEGRIRPSIQEKIVGSALLFVLYGIFVLFFCASIYSLVRLNNRNRRTTIALSLALLALFSSTTAYTVITFLQQLEAVFSIFTTEVSFLWLGANVILEGNPVVISNSTRTFLLCAPTAAMTINIILGDAIVCWRACVVWQGNRVVVGACIMLLMTTFAMGIVDTKYSCWTSGILTDGGSWKPDPHADGTGNLYWGFSYGVAATSLSLSTNLFATLAIAVRAWQSRRVLKQYIATGPTVSQMRKVLSILVESGVIYCALWVVVLAWQAGNYEGIRWYTGDNSFWDLFNTIMGCALVPLIAIYPMVIIVLVALNRSHMENGFKTPSLSSIYRLPLSPLTASVNPTITTRSESQPRGRSDGALVIDHEGFRSRDDLEGSGTHAKREGLETLYNATS